MRPALALVLLLALAPAALAQEHGHAGDAGMAMVLHDGPPDGRAVVGGYTHFGFALLDKDGAPVAHQDAEFNVVQNGEVLFSTTDTHEYDGLFSFDVRFARPGPYLVTATSGEMRVGVFEGVAVEPASAAAASVRFDATPAGPASRAVDVVLSIVDASGSLIPHTDAIVEFRDASTGQLESRSHLHVHDAPIAFTQALGPGLDHVAQVVAYRAFPSGDADEPDVPAVVAEFPVVVGPLAPPALPAPDPTPPALLEQVGASASQGGYTLTATYDPNNQVGVGQAARLAGILVDDANRSPVAHVDFAFALSGPRGLAFSSESLHEYDGVFEHLFVPDAPGVYDGTLVARKGGVELGVPVRLLVVPPVAPVAGSAGRASVSIDGLDGIRAGVPANLTFSAMAQARPAAHSEVDVTIFHDGEPPLYQFKLHTHGSGLTNAIVVLPHEGEWKVRVDALPTVPEPTLYPTALFAFDVAPGLPDGLAAGAAVEGAKAPVPAAGALLAVLALALALRRR